MTDKANKITDEFNLNLTQHQYDALVIDTYQRGQNIWDGRLSHEPLANYLKCGDFSDLSAATAAFNYDLDADKGRQNRRIMGAEYFVTGSYTDIR